MIFAAEVAALVVPLRGRIVVVVAASSAAILVHGVRCRLRFHAFGVLAPEVGHVLLAGALGLEALPCLAVLPRELGRTVMTHKYSGCIVILSINKSVETQRGAEGVDEQF
jgi:hypothetical protein